MNNIYNDPVYAQIRAGLHTIETVLQINSTGAVSARYTDAELKQLPGILIYTNQIFSVNTNSVIFSGNTLEIGCCTSRVLSARLFNITEPIPRCARVVPFVRLVNATEQSDWIPKGVFYIDTRKITKAYENAELLDIEGYDAMMRAEQLYVHNGDVPRRDIDVVRDIADAIGVTVDSRTVDAMTDGHMINKVDQYSMREVLGYIASWYGGNFVMSDTGELQLIRLVDLAEPPGPIIKRQTGDLTVMRSTYAVFTVTAYGLGPLTYQWYFRSRPTAVWNKSPADGNTTKALRIQATAGRDGYQYRCIVTDVNGKEIASEAATLTSKIFSITVHPTDVIASSGTTVYFHVGTDSKQLTYQWQFKTPTGNWGSVQGGTTDTLTVSATNSRNGNQYRCRITDVAGNVLTSNAATLTVIRSLMEVEEDEWQTV